MGQRRRKISWACHCPRRRTGWGPPPAALRRNPPRATPWRGTHVPLRSLNGAHGNPWVHQPPPQNLRVFGSGGGAGPVVTPGSRGSAGKEKNPSAAPDRAGVRRTRAVGATWEPPWVSAMSSRPETLLNSDSATVPGAGGERPRAAAVQPPAGSGAGVCVCVHAPPACGLSRSQRAAWPDSPVAPAGGTGATPAARGPVPVAPPWSALGRGAHRRGWPHAGVSCREHQRLRVNPAGLLPRDLQRSDEP